MPYEPMEDSFLLEKHVRKYSRGHVLDMGTGSGIQALAAAKDASSVLALDIDPEAIKYCKRKIKNKRITFWKSDLFSYFKGSTPLFDLIIFNPPYLPDNPRSRDIALDGGKKGYEILERFLDHANSYLKKDGRILVVFSSYTNKDKVNEIIMNNCLAYTEIDRQKLDFEELYVYLIQKSMLLKELEKKGANNIRFFAKGHRGVIYTAKLGKKNIAIKTELPSSHAVDRMENEARMLKIVNEHGIGPVLLFSGKKYFAYGFVSGELILDFIEKSSRSRMLEVLREIMQQMHTLDSINISKEEMHHPVKHIIVDKRPVLIDFERARHTQNPHNMTQFCQFLIHISSMLEKKGIAISKQKMISMAKQYSADKDPAPLLDALR